jgi:hypothetical protein
VIGVANESVGCDCGWMDGLKVGEIKSPHAGHKSGLMWTTPDEKLKDQKETNRKTDRIRQYKKKKCS